MNKQYKGVVDFTTGAMVLVEVRRAVGPWGHTILVELDETLPSGYVYVTEPLEE